MRLRHVKRAKAILEKSSYVIEDIEKFQGKVTSLFENDNDVHLEIGMGKGDFIISMAKTFPDINFIGMEKYDSVLMRACEKLENEKLDNLKLIRFDAIDIEKIFNQDISVLYLNFSDPWPKKRHEHRRLTSERFLKRYDKIFKGNNVIIQKTDNQTFFEFSLKSFVDYGYKIENISFNLHDSDNFNIETEYERKFAPYGSVYMVKVVKWTLFDIEKGEKTIKKGEYLV